LAAAVTTGEPTTPPPRGPVCRGQPLSFWLEQLKDLDPALRAEAVYAIGLFGKDGAEQSPALLKLLTDAATPQWPKQHNVASVAADVLARMEPVNDNVISAFGRALRVRNRDVQFPIIRALRQLGDRAKGVVPDLIAVVSEPEQKTMRVEAAKALHLIGPVAKEALPALRAATEDKDQALANAARAAIKAIEQ
jgi:HEAT repeat protein